jgi:hypothetical protein
MVFPAAAADGKFGAAHFAKADMQHQIAVLTDLSQTLREEERSAWQRLLRVLGHD